MTVVSAYINTAVMRSGIQRSVGSSNDAVVVFVFTVFIFLVGLFSVCVAGQEEGVESEVAYNVFRWYRGGWRRYTQSDPAELRGDAHPYAYAQQNPFRFVDLDGLKAEIVCASIGIFGLKNTPAQHCRLQVTCENCEELGNLGGPYDTSVGLERNLNTGKLQITEQAIGASYGDAYPIEGVDQQNSCQFGRCVRSYSALFDQQGKAAQWEPQYSIFGPNSNTYVAHLIYLCGGWVSFPPGAVGGNSGWFK